MRVEALSRLMCMVQRFFGRENEVCSDREMEEGLRSIYNVSEINFSKQHQATSLYQRIAIRRLHAALPSPMTGTGLTRMSDNTERSPNRRRGVGDG